MGLICSGEVSDATFYEQCERHFMLNRNVQNLFQIKAYLRLKDDLLIIIGGTSESRKRCLHSFMRRCRSFKSLVESISNPSSVFLDSILFKGGSWGRIGRLDVGMHFKPTALGIPLSGSS